MSVPNRKTEAIKQQLIEAAAAEDERLRREKEEEARRWRSLTNLSAVCEAFRRALTFAVPYVDAETGLPVKPLPDGATFTENPYDRRKVAWHDDPRWRDWADQFLELANLFDRQELWQHLALLESLALPAIIKEVDWWLSLTRSQPLTYEQVESGKALALDLLKTAKTARAIDREAIALMLARGYWPGLPEEGIKRFAALSGCLPLFKRALLETLAEPLVAEVRALPRWPRGGFYERLYAAVPGLFPEWQQVIDSPTDERPK